MKKLLLTTFFTLHASLFPSVALMAQGVNPPTMGWSSWNTFALNINEELIKSQADAMVSTGLSEAGYKYINIDDGFWDGRGRDSQIRLNTTLFPNGMRYLTDYIHGLGLMAGIYSDAGDNTCGSGNTKPYGLNVGFYGHEDDDCKVYFKDWNFDFIKVDYCGGGHLSLNEQLQYTKISQAIKRQADQLGKRIVFNVCRWAYPGTWISDVADSWRTTGDIWCGWESVRDIIKENLYIQAYTGGGHYNDMDMLEIGRTLSHDEEVTHMAYWCIASSPLLIGCDLTNIPEASLNLLKNKDLIAMNQDPLGLGAPVVYRSGDVYVVAKDMEQLHGSKRAFVAMNLGNSQRTITLDPAVLEMSGDLSLHNCLTGSDETLAEGSRLRLTIPAHGSQAYFVSGTRVDRKRYQGEEAWANQYQEISNLPNARPMESSSADQGWYMGWLGNLANNYMEWRDVYCTKAGRYNLAIRYATAENRAFEVAANGKSYGFLDNLNSGAWDSNWDIANIEVNLNAGYNTIRLGEPASFAPNVDYIELTLLEETGIILDGSLRGDERSEGWGLMMKDESNNPSSLISHPSSVYDLQGRVGGGPGIVIVNGKKILTHK